MICPDCNGTGESGIVPTFVRFADNATAEGRSEENLRKLAEHFAKCLRCRGTGTAPDEHAAWIAAGNLLRDFRMHELKMGLRATAEAIGVLPSQLSYAEHGTADPAGLLERMKGCCGPN